MLKNTAGQKLTVFAFDATTNLPKSADAANITAYYDLDDAGVTVLTDTSATEAEATNAKGYYIFDLAQAETNGNKILYSGKSTTANVVVIAVPAVVYTVPATFVAATFPGTVASPTNITAGTITTVTTLTNLPAITAGWLTATGIATDALSAAAVSAAAVTKIQAGLSTYAGGDTAGTTTLLSRVTGAVALASQIPANFTTATFASAGVFATAALANAPGGTGSVDVNVVTVLGQAPTQVTLVGGNVPCDLQAIQTQATSAAAPVAFPAAIGTSTYAGGPVASVTAGVGVAAGAISSASFTIGTVSGRPAGIVERIMQLWRALYGPSDKAVGTGHIRTKADDGTTILTTQNWTDDGAGNETLGISS